MTLLFTISICILTSIFIWANADSNSVIVVVVYNVLLCVSIITIFIVGKTFLKKSPSVFIELDSVLTINALFKYMFGNIS